MISVFFSGTITSPDIRNRTALSELLKIPSDPQSLRFSPILTFVEAQLSLQFTPASRAVYQPRGISVLQILFKKHFQRIGDQYEDKYAIIYGRFNIERITEKLEKFVLCGNYTPGTILQTKLLCLKQS